MPEKIKALIDGKGHITLSIGILLAIILSACRISVQLDRVARQVDDNSRNRWTSIHQQFYNQQLRLVSKHDTPNVQEILRMVDDEIK